jgi:hypothetical protein
MEAVLRAYRANPTDARFGDVFRVARPWLKATGISTLKTYPSLSLSGSLDDVVLEGALALSRSTRRFIYLCDSCGAAKIHLSDLAAHQREEHRVRGALPLVGLSTFSRTSARLAMKRTARRLLRPEILDEEPEVVEACLRPAEDVEAAMIFEVFVRRLRTRLSARALANLELLLASDLEGVDPRAIEVLRREVDSIVHRG